MVNDARKGIELNANRTISWKFTIYLSQLEACSLFLRRLNETFISLEHSSTVATNCTSTQTNFSIPATLTAENLDLTKLTAPTQTSKTPALSETTEKNSKIQNPCGKPNAAQSTNLAMHKALFAPHRWLCSNAPLLGVQCSLSALNIQRDRQRLERKQTQAKQRQRNGRGRTADSHSCFA
ncbi:unnamed protein product [Ceratitis capitata]|uniref:(Mediterranean fruit fly) hypothetical protein n=1 Tax=Ceratitis capitata TaxID=7213 RepID=A0A811VE01_CERCA|nr:unnamed protein product [Ceratitis capitata]